MFRSSVTPAGFVVGIHKPSFSVANFRGPAEVTSLGRMDDGSAVLNRRNFPEGDVVEEAARWIYEIANPFTFRGATFIDSGWAESRALHPETIRIADRPACSLSGALADHVDRDQLARLLKKLPRPVLYDLAANSTDPDELVLLARNCCRFVLDDHDQPVGLYFQDTGSGPRAEIDDFELFETIANNPCLPDTYKEVMVLRPGVQGASEIVGEVCDNDTHVYEYLRRNSYIPWGHFAANMAEDAIRYRTSDLDQTDMQGLRHLYYQRTYAVLADQLGIPVDVRGRMLSVAELEELRREIMTLLANHHPNSSGQQKDESRVYQAGTAPGLHIKNGGPAKTTLWGWNFGYDFSGSGYRLHASHQMIHQQYAMVPEEVETLDGASMPAFGCGDQVADTIAGYRRHYDRDFFSDYLSAIRTNRRMDGRDLEASLIVHEDDAVMLFVPKAQVSQWELQIMVTADSDGRPVGNVLEADTQVRAAIDQAILKAQHIYAALGAAMVTSIEYPRRIGAENGQRLLYAFLPKLPWSMGAFSEAQQRFICGHFPEDFARACRAALKAKTPTQS